MGGFSANTNNQPSGSDVVFASNVDFSGQANPASTILTNGQLLIGTTNLNAGNTHINVGTLTSPDGSITIGYSSPNITLVNAGGAHAVDSFAMQTGTSPVVPDANGLVTFNGSRVVAGTNPVRTNGTAANTMQLEVQISQAIAATDATKIGLSNFNSAHFSVDANGFVGLVGGGQATDSFAMQTGTSPVVPDGNGLVTFNGSRVAAGTNPVRTNGTGANTMQLEVQISQAIASTDATKIGLSNFDSATFTVDANGFVTLNNIVNPATTSIVFDDFIYNDTDQQTLRQNCWGPFGVFNSGGGWSSANVSNHPGVLKLTSTATGFEYLLGSGGDAGWGPASSLYAYDFEWMMKIDTLSSANPNYTLYLGCVDNAAGAVASSNGYWFQYNHAVNSGNWQMVCQSGGTATASSTTAADTNWHRFKISVNAAGTSVAFYIDGVQLTNSPIATNITTNRVSPRMLCNTTSGTNQKSFNFDYFYAKFVFTR